MPIYKQEEYPSVIERIKTKIAQKNIDLGPTVSEADIIAFERACNTRLPQAYRLFLQEVGDGQRDPAMGISAPAPFTGSQRLSTKTFPSPWTLTDGWGLGRMRRTKSSLANESFGT